MSFTSFETTITNENFKHAKKRKGKSELERKIVAFNLVIVSWCSMLFVCWLNCFYYCSLFSFVFHIKYFVGFCRLGVCVSAFEYAFYKICIQLNKIVRCIIKITKFTIYSLYTWYFLFILVLAFCYYNFFIFFSSAKYGATVCAVALNSIKIKALYFFVSRVQLVYTNVCWFFPLIFVLLLFSVVYDIIFCSFLLLQALFSLKHCKFGLKAV